MTDIERLTTRFAKGHGARILRAYSSSGVPQEDIAALINKAFDSVSTSADVSQTDVKVEG